MMIKKIGLTKEYIKVRRNNGGLTFGGNQNFFNVQEASEADRRKKESGCGIVAFADLLLYLANVDKSFLTTENSNYVNRELPEEIYKEYFNRIYDFMGGISHKLGISGLTIWFRFNRMARRNGWKLRARWGFSGKKIFARIEEMLKKDIPVILCIPMMLLKKDRDDKLALYVRKFDDRTESYQYQVAEKTNAHYVTVTGILQEDENIYLTVSSWGKEYYINWKEYDTYIKTHFLGKILGNILYIR